jgi:hypothetical protein
MEKQCAPMGGFVGKNGCLGQERVEFVLKPARDRSHNLIDTEAQYAAANSGGYIVST